jgi:PAS domain S-box-containing protein
MTQEQPKNFTEILSQLFSGGGELTHLIKDKNWEETALGAMENWPAGLRTITNIILENPLGMCIAWGKEYIQIYNEAYYPVTWSAKHPNALGKGVKEVFSELWHVIGPLLDEVMHGKAANLKDVEIALNRNEKTENLWFDFSFSPLRNEFEAVAGVLIIAIEKTCKVKEVAHFKESKEELEFALEAAELATWDYNPLTKKFSANHRFKTWVGLAASNEIVLQDVINNVADKDRERVKAAMQTALDNNSGGNYDVEYAIVNADDGSEKIVQAKGKVWFNADNVAYRFNGTLQEVTDKVLARIKTKVSEKEFRQLADSLPDLVWTTDKNGEQLFASEKWVEFTGVNPYDETTFTAMIHPDDRQKVTDVWSACLASGNTYKTNLRVKNKSGNYEWFYAHGEAIKNEQGEIERWIGSFINVHEQKRIEEELIQAISQIEKNEERFRTLADNMSQLAWMADEKGLIYWFNQRWYDYTGYTLDDMQGWGWEKVHHPEHLERVVKRLQHSWDTGENWEDTFPIKGKDGEYNWFLSRALPIRDKDGNIIRWFGTNTNITKQKSNEEDLAYRTALLEAYHQASFDGILLVDSKGKIISNNQRFNDLWNMPVEITNAKDDNAALDFAMSKLVNAQQFIDKVNFLYNNPNESSIDELEFIDGRIIERYGYTVKGKDGKFYAWAWVFRDITEKKKYEKSILENEERLSIIIDASAMGTWELNLQRNELKYSKKYLEIMGFNPGDNITHIELLSGLHPEDLEIRKIAFDEAYVSGILHYDFRIIWKDHSVHWVSARGKVFFNEFGKPLSILGTLRDITEGKNYQAKLEEREEKFRLLADSMPQFVWTGDAAGTLNYFNQAVYDYSGLSAERIAKDGWLQIVHPDDRDKNIEAWLHSIKTGEDFLLEHRFGRYDGEYRWQLSRAIAQRDAAGNIKMWVGTSTDIQDIKEQEQQKDFFISMASHELKTPVTSIKGYVQLLQSAYKNSEDPFLTKSLTVINKQISTLTVLIADLLDVSKIKSGNLVLNHENFDMSELVEEVLEHIQHINPDHKFIYTAFTVDVYADRERISQVIINFLNNAIKYAPDSKEIVVKSYIENSEVIVLVQDFGIGIGKAEQERIFERFYRVEGKNEKTFPGFGIGLFICAEIIERHKGNIGVRSELGSGSDFYFSLPLKK